MKLVYSRIAPLLVHEESINPRQRVSRQYIESVGWMLLGGTILFQASDEGSTRSENFRVVTLQFHGGRNLWSIDDEHCVRGEYKPRNSDFGALKEMMARFEEITGLSLPRIEINHMNGGVWSYSSSEAVRIRLSREFTLRPGFTYELPPRLGQSPRRYVGRDGTQEVRDADEAGSGEFFNPWLVFSGDDWLEIARTNARLDSNVEVVRDSRPRYSAA